MFTKVFVLGRPGSGKSTVVRHIVELAQRRNYSTVSMKDYDLLYQMFQIDVTYERFRPADYGGFDVLDHAMFDVALKQLEENVHMLSSVQENQLMTIEFARNDYRTALKFFSSAFLQDAYIFFVEADLQCCMKRIHKRVITPSEPDHHFVSDYIMQTYYYQDNWVYMSSSLRQDYPACKEVVAVRNTTSLSELLNKVDDFAEMILLREFSIRRYLNNEGPVKELEVSLL